MEEQLLDKATGICVNPNHLNYKVPSIKDMPEMVPIMVESVDNVWALSAPKGLGEAALQPARAGHSECDIQRHRRALYRAADHQSCHPHPPEGEESVAVSEIHDISEYDPARSEGSLSDYPSSHCAVLVKILGIYLIPMHAQAFFTPALRSE